MCVACCTVVQHGVLSTCPIWKLFAICSFFLLHIRLDNLCLLSFPTPPPPKNDILSYFTNPASRSVQHSATLFGFSAGTTYFKEAAALEGIR